MEMEMESHCFYIFYSSLNFISFFRERERERERVRVRFLFNGFGLVRWESTRK